MPAPTLSTLLSGNVVDVARDLLGWTLRSMVGGAATAVTITETEAYAGSSDPASHAYRGRTARNATMFGRPGLLYVYRSYGIHWCMNVVVGGAGEAHAVLFRGGEITEGHDTIVARRGRRDHLTDGPGKLGQALGVTGEHDGVDLRTGTLRLVPGPGVGDRRISKTPWIGITKATERLWRFVVLG